MKIEKIKSKLKKVFNRVMGVLLPVATLFVSCGTNALVVHATESKNDMFTFIAKNELIGTGWATYKASLPIEFDGYKLVGSISETVSDGIVGTKTITFYYVKDNQKYTLYSLKDILNEYFVIENESEDKNGHTSQILEGYWRFAGLPYSGIKYYENEPYEKYSFTVISGKCPIVKDDDLNNYVLTGEGADIIKPDELEKGWYLKNVSYKVTADDSPSSEAGADATYIHFTWDTDNVQNGDLIEIKTYNYYKKIGGEKLSGFHDFITYSDGVGASSGEYSFSQYTATKAWFNSLENKPLMFKDYDTTDYYIRPVRMGALGVEKYGMWVHVRTKRSTPTSSPILDKDSSFDYGDFDENGEWIRDDELTEKNGGIHGMDQNGNWISPDDDNLFTGTNLAGMFSYFFGFMKNIPSMLADLPALVSSIIGFLPSAIIGFVGVGIVIAIILRVVGR